MEKINLAFAETHIDTTPPTYSVQSPEPREQWVVKSGTDGETISSA